MDSVIAFTPAELVTGILGICGLITSIAAVVAIILNGVRKAKEPNKIQDARILEIEKRLDMHDEMIAKFIKRLEKMDSGNRHVQRSLLALLSAAIDGDHIEEVRKARDELQEYLINSN